MHRIKTHWSQGLRDRARTWDYGFFNFDIENSANFSHTMCSVVQISKIELRVITLNHHICLHDSQDWIRCWKAIHAFVWILRTQSMILWPMHIIETSYPTCHGQVNTPVHRSTSNLTIHQIGMIICLFEYKYQINKSISWSRKLQFAPSIESIIWVWVGSRLGSMKTMPMHIRNGTVLMGKMIYSDIAAVLLNVVFVRATIY